MTNHHGALCHIAKIYLKQFSINELTEKDMRNLREPFETGDPWVIWHLKKREMKRQNNGRHMKVDISFRPVHNHKVCDPRLQEAIQGLGAGEEKWNVSGGVGFSVNWD